MMLSYTCTHANNNNKKYEILNNYNNEGSGFQYPVYFRISKGSLII